MKIKMTRKSVVNSFVNIRCAGYCDLQALLRNHEPIAYTAGVYGWNFDVYSVYGSTGSSDIMCPERTQQKNWE